MKNKPYSQEYQAFVKVILDRFMEQNSSELDYWDYINYIERSGDRKCNYRQPNVVDFVNIQMDGCLEIPAVKAIINKRKEDSLKWLKENFKTEEEFLKSVNNENEKN